MAKSKKTKFVQVKKEKSDFSIFMSLINNFLKKFKKTNSTNDSKKDKGNSVKKISDKNKKDRNVNQKVTLDVANTDPQDPNSKKVELKDETVAFMIFSKLK
ncbi:MAG: hypothetical protein KDK54_18980 [Leptospiraceae bacterium]|nr:hypothetical protein [Leptospiraceae bacterium]